MRKITLILSLMLFSGIAFCQNAPIDFESGGYGASWTWTTFENDTNPSLEIVANPSTSGINSSSTVAKFTALQNGQQWAGCESAHGADIGAFTLDATTSTIKIMVYKPVISDVGIKLVENGSGSLGEIKVANTVTNAWEELTFDFSSREGIEYDQIVIFMDFQARTSDNICYFDNITFNATAGLAEPTTAADDPTHASTDVISLFSGVYTNVAVTTWRTSWSSATLTDVQVDGNDVKKYSALDFVGIETVGADLIDASGMTHLNMDVWSPNSTVFKIKIVDFGADGGFQGGDDSEHELTFNAPATEEWVNYSIPLTDFTGLTGTEHIAQIILVSQPTGTSVIYLDNVFFSVGSGIAEPTAAAPDPTFDEADVISMFCGIYTDVAVTTWRTSWSSATLTDVQVDGNDVKKYSELDFVGIETVGADLIDASSMDHINFAIWSPNSTTFKIKIVDFGADGGFQGGDDSEHELVFDAPANGEWINYRIPLSDFTGLASTENIAQIILVSAPSGSSIVYLDNMFFSQGSAASIAPAAVWNTFDVYPNPAVNTLNIELEANTAMILDYTIMDVTGKVVYTEAVNSTLYNKTLNVSDFGSGVYYLQVVSEQGVSSQKFVIQ